jgi:hypothetical protein
VMALSRPRADRKSIQQALPRRIYPLKRTKIELMLKV